MRRIIRYLRIVFFRRFPRLGILMKPVVITLVTGFFSYLIVAYMNRDIVTVESVVVRNKEMRLPIDLTMAFNISKNLKSAMLDEQDNTLSDLTNLDRDFLLITLKRLKDKVTTLSKQLDEYKENEIAISSMKDSITQKDLENLNVTKVFFGYNSLNKMNIKHSKADIIENYIKKPIERINKEKNELEDLIKQIVKKSLKTLEENKNNFQIEVIAFNEGNTQTVLRNRGLLELGYTQLNLKKVENIRIGDYYTKLSNAMSGKVGREGSSNYLIIEPKSFVTLNLEVDYFNNKDRDIQVVKREYINGQSGVYLTLFDIKNTPLKKLSFRLQTDLEYDSNEELNKFINENLQLYVEK